MDILEQKIDALLGSPVGCAFVLGVECNSPPEQFASPLASFQLAADSVDFCDIDRDALSGVGVAARCQAARFGPPDTGASRFCLVVCAG